MVRYCRGPEPDLSTSFTAKRFPAPPLENDFDGGSIKTSLGWKFSRSQSGESKRRLTGRVAPFSQEWEVLLAGL